MERWKQIKDFPDYEVSDNGRVKSLKNNSENIKTNVKRSDGHFVVGLSRNGKYTTKLLHRLIAEAFIPNPDNLPFVRHLNDDPTDNRLENLAWGYQKDNIQDSIRNGTHYGVSRRKPIVAIKDGKCQNFISQHEAARTLNLPVQNISKCVKGTLKTVGGYIFKEQKPKT